MFGSCLVLISTVNHPCSMSSHLCPSQLCRTSVFLILCVGLKCVTDSVVLWLETTFDMLWGPQHDTARIAITGVIWRYSAGTKNRPLQSTVRFVADDSMQIEVSVQKCGYVALHHHQVQ